MSNHVHDGDSGLVKLIYCFFWWDTNSRDEKLGTFRDTDINKLWELPLCVVIVGLAGTAADLWDKKIDTERSVLVVEMLLESIDLSLEELWSISNASNDTQSAGLLSDNPSNKDSTYVCNGSCELGTSSNVHAGKQDWVLDAKEL